MASIRSTHQATYTMAENLPASTKNLLIGSFRRTLHHSLKTSSTISASIHRPSDMTRSQLCSIRGSLVSLATGFHWVMTRRSPCMSKNDSFAKWCGLSTSPLTLKWWAIRMIIKLTRSNRVSLLLTRRYWKRQARHRKTKASWTPRLSSSCSWTILCQKT